MFAALAFPVHVFLKLEHALACCRARQIISRWMITDISHNVFRHTHKTIARIDASVWTYRKSILHAIDKGAYCTPTSEDASAVVIDISNFNLAHIFKILVQEIDQQLAILFGRECPFLRLLTT